MVILKLIPPEEHVITLPTGKRVSIEDEVVAIATGELNNSWEGWTFTASGLFLSDSGCMEESGATSGTLPAWLKHQAEEANAPFSQLLQQALKSYLQID